jgi:hypothetical protein
MGVKTTKVGTAAAGGGGDLYFLLCSIQMTIGGSSIQMKNCSHFSF